MKATKSSRNVAILLLKNRVYPTSSYKVYIHNNPKPKNLREKSMDVRVREFWYYT